MCEENRKCLQKKTQTAQIMTHSAKKNKTAYEIMSVHANLADIAPDSCWRERP